MITVIAGVNGAGKSSIAGAHLSHLRGDYFNPDEVAAGMMARNPALPQAEANAAAWQTGFEQLRQAIEDNKSYTLETTLGGHSICQLLHRAMDQGRPVRIFYVGLSTPELHVQRVAERVARGGHAIPEAKIRERCVSAIHNMMALIPKCAAVRVFDNSAPANENGPQPVCLFSLQGDQFDNPPVDPMPGWAKPLASKAIERVIGKSC